MKINKTAKIKSKVDFKLIPKENEQRKIELRFQKQSLFKIVKNFIIFIQAKRINIIVLKDLLIFKKSLFSVFVLV